METVNNPGVAHEQGDHVEAKLMEPAQRLPVRHVVAGG